jgi:hypothetical protein
LARRDAKFFLERADTAAHKTRKWYWDSASFFEPDRRKMS